MSAAGDNLAVWRAQLADMPLGTIIAYLREQTEAEKRAYLPYCPCELCKQYRARLGLPVGYSPLADADLPFDGEDRRP